MNECTAMAHGGRVNLINLNKKGAAQWLITEIASLHERTVGRWCRPSGGSLILFFLFLVYRKKREGRKEGRKEEEEAKLMFLLLLLQLVNEGSLRIVEQFVKKEKRRENLMTHCHVSEGAYCNYVHILHTHAYTKRVGKWIAVCLWE